jgi:hypothetical protein
MGDPFYPAFRALGQRLLEELAADFYASSARGTLHCYRVTQLEYYALLATICSEEELRHAGEYSIFMNFRGIPVIRE